MIKQYKHGDIYIIVDKEREMIWTFISFNFWKKLKIKTPLYITVQVEYFDFIISYKTRNANTDATHIVMIYNSNKPKIV